MGLLKQMFLIICLFLCVVLIMYISYIVKHRIDEEIPQETQKQMNNEPIETIEVKDETQPIEKRPLIKTFDNFSTREVEQNVPMFENFTIFDKKKNNEHNKNVSADVDDNIGILRKTVFNRYVKIEPRTPMYYKMNNIDFNTSAKL